MPEKQEDAHAIVVDWGTTSLRAYLVTRDGVVLAEKKTGSGGIQFIADGRFEESLVGAIGGWLESAGKLPVIALGMVTSRNGWVEVPYVPCPANVAALARGTMRRLLPNGSDLIFLPGLTDPRGTPFPDVMRGEETQIVGFGLSTDITLVLPGTHSKWARVESGEIASFQTFVTGELYALLTRHSFIARSAGAAPEGPPDWNAFDRGAALAAERQPPTLLSELFSARTGMLAGRLKAQEIRDYVSGLIIAHEFAEAREQGWFKAGDTIGIVGNDGLNERYVRVAPLFGLAAVHGPDDAALLGALAISTCA
ncbi:2-dehydro-3-deoxygalactonokinase [Chelativorans sp. AA-79]|uniref:2-dehydro-3-deoxygalactonokinase n=1 Tax=Chelativorans sp. AA-79 TaxID=3028735 RepID=UPI0023F977AD|nr:2-dehydro-3-deoxygalactonokinase [Chelativorans sp. AA-79]WEX11060.1 2-dehydro-3-deoxygalactonokinase [Chelativorans sp. AA-79]